MSPLHHKPTANGTILILRMRLALRSSLNTMMDGIDNHLLRDLDRLAKRVNSEEGVPMFLACEDRAVGVMGDEARNIAPRELNDEFVSMFRRDVEFVRNSRPDAPLTYIATIVERLALQDFAIGKKE